MVILGCQGSRMSQQRSLERLFTVTTSRGDWYPYGEGFTLLELKDRNLR
jgi:hypothetical protein